MKPNSEISEQNQSLIKPSKQPAANRRQTKQQEKTKLKQDIIPLKAGSPPTKARMSSKELFFLIMLYLTDPHAKGTKDYKLMTPTTVLKKLQELRFRLDYLEID
jgi:hypothetical protein